MSIDQVDGRRACRRPHRRCERPSLTDFSLFIVDGDESSEYELKPMKYAKYANVFYSVPHFLALLDDFAERIATGGGACPTFADGLAAQRVLSAIGYEA